MSLTSAIVAAAAAAISLARAPSGDLSRLGTGDFDIRFTLRTSSQLDSAVINQRAACSHGDFWGVRMGADGSLGIETDGGEYTVLVAPQAHVNDGAPHAVAITRHAGQLSLVIDDRAVTAHSAASFGSLAPLAIGTDPCDGVDGTHALPGAVSDVRVTRRSQMNALAR
jgi:hypothetical protein